MEKEGRREEGNERRREDIGRRVIRKNRRRGRELWRGRKTRNERKKRIMDKKG